MGTTTIYDKFMNQIPIEHNGAKTVDEIFEDNLPKADSVDPVHKRLDSKISDTNGLICIIFHAG